MYTYQSRYNLHFDKQTITDTVNSMRWSTCTWFLQHRSQYPPIRSQHTASILGANYC